MVVIDIVLDIVIAQLRRGFPRLADTLQARAVMLRKAITFGLIGVLNTFVDVGVFTLGVNVVGLPIVPANVLSWAVAVSGSYALNSHITFSAESGRQLTWQGYGKFVASGIVGLIANTLTVVVLAAQLVPMLGENGVVVAKLCATVVSFVVNFSMSHFFIFRPRPQVEPISERVSAD